MIFFVEKLLLKIISKSELSIKGLSTDTEAFIIMVGVVDFLDRPGIYFKLEYII